MASSASETPFCAALMREGDDPIYGTATQVEVWFLLEYRAPWRRKATADNELPPPVQEHLDAYLASIPESRLLFIKQDDNQGDELRFYVIKTGEIAPLMWRFTLQTYDELLALDLAAMVEGVETYDRFLRQDPLFLVCTNGMRDRCCAKYGWPIYEALREAQGEAVWQSTHIGGHRYAPNVLFLPHSVNYGLFSVEEAVAAAEAYLDGRLANLAHYRGRTYYPPHVQAAGYFLRRDLAYETLTGLRLLAEEPAGEDSWTVHFYVIDADENHELVIKRHLTAEKRLVSCSSPKEKAVERYTLQDT